MKRRSPGIRLWFEVLEERTLMAITPTLIDVDVGISGSNPQELVDVNGTLYFTAEDSKGRELWKSDGTAAGTQLVEDIRPGAASSNPRDLINVNGTLYFTADDGTSGRELWKSTGTEAGTVRVANIGPGSISSHAERLTAVGNRVFFRADNDGDGVNKLYVSDGTTAGTKILKDFGSHIPSNLTNLNGFLMFVEFKGSSDAGDVIAFDTDLWRSDGTVAGTQQVHGVDSGALAAIDGTLFFSGQGSAFLGTFEPWTSDGTHAGTDRLKNINQRIGGHSFPLDFTGFQGSVYFSADDGPNNHGREIWKTDGTTSGTQFFLDIYSGPDSSDPGEFEEVGDQLFFAALDPNKGRELFVSDGSAFGTEILDLAVGDSGSDSNPEQLTNANGQFLFFVADVNLTGGRVFRTDGTIANTELVDTGVGSEPAELTAVSAETIGRPSKLFFAADTNDLDQSPDVGRELFMVEVPAPLLRPINIFPRITNVSLTGSVLEGGVAMLTGQLEDPDPDDELFLDIDWGDNSPLETIQPGHEAFSIQHLYRDDLPSGTSADEHVVFLTWRDSRGGGNSTSLVVTVYNVPPVLEAGGDALVVVNQLFKRSGLFVDPGDDSWTGTVNFGDGSGDQPLVLRDGQFTLKHHYRQAGEYTVTVTVEDDDGGTSTQTFLVTVLPKKAAPQAALDSEALDVLFALWADDSVEKSRKHRIF
jgi:ELWxxDGT repeat protein